MFSMFYHVNKYVNYVSYYISGIFYNVNKNMNYVSYYFRE